MPIKRLGSIDVFRAITMYFMVFVNDLWTDLQVPGWLEHAPAQADAMGFSDVIFPAFLFIVGLSIPLSQESRLAAGEKKTDIFWHIVLRSFALIVMGFYEVNMENYSSEALLSEPIWTILVTMAFFLIWMDYRRWKPGTRLTLQITGIVLLLLMAALYEGEREGNTIWMRKQWWGILGLIGWSYFACATLYLGISKRLFLLVACFLFFLFFNASVHLHWPPFMQVVSGVTGKLVQGNGSNASVIMLGVITSVLYSRLGNKSPHLWLVLLSMAVLLIVFGFSTRPLWGISKIQATPSWTTICSGISVLCFMALIFVVDKKGKESWFAILKPAGTSTLTCYLLPYFYYPVFISLINIRLPILLRTGMPGIIKSLLFALLIVWLTGLLEKQRLRLKL